MAAVRIIIFTLLALLALLLMVLNRQQAWQYSAPQLNVFQCVVPGGVAGKRLDVLTLMPTGAIPLAKTLCADKVVSNNYGAVRVEWRPRANITAKEILEGRYAFMWNRQRVLAGLVPEVHTHYQALSTTPDYSAFWITPRANLDFSQATLNTLSIGLLDNQMSQSGYLLPVHYLDERGIDVSALDIRYYNNYLALEAAFANQEIDMIASFLADPQRLSKLRQQPLYRYPIVENIPTGSWFIQQSLMQNVDLRCQLLQATAVLRPYNFHASQLDKGAQACQ